MPRYKHVSKKAAVRRRRKFESRFTFRISKSWFHATTAWARLGQAMSKAADQAAIAMRDMPRPYFIGIDRAAPNPDSDKTALALVTRSGDVSTVEGVIILDQVDGNKLSVNESEKEIIRKAEMRPYTSTPLTGDEMDSLLELQDRGIVTIFTDDFYNIEDVVVNIDLDQEDGIDNEQ